MVIYLAAFAIVVVACTTQAAIGFGGNLIAMPTVALLDADLVPGSVLIAVTIQNLLMLLRDREHLELGSVSSALVGRAFGTVAAIFVLREVSKDGLQLMVAITVLILVAVTSSALTPKRTTATMLGAGSISGFFAGTSGIGGPPVALMFQRESGSQIRGSMGGFFTVGTSMTIIGLAVAGKLGWWELKWGLALLPAGAIGFLLSAPLLPVVDRGWTRPGILIISSSAAVVILLRLGFG